MNCRASVNRYKSSMHPAKYYFFFLYLQSVSTFFRVISFLTVYHNMWYILLLYNHLHQTWRPSNTKPIVKSSALLRPSNHTWLPSGTPFSITMNPPKDGSANGVNDAYTSPPSSASPCASRSASHSSTTPPTQLLLNS